MEDRAQDHPLLPARFLWASFQPHQPQVPLLQRQRLVARLDEALRVRLLLVNAPAGCGKSTLLAQWFHSLRADNRVKCAWLNIVRDAGPSDLLLAVCWALEIAGTSLGDSGLLSESADDGGDFQERLAVLLSAVAQNKQPVILIVDELDRLRDPESLALMELLIGACPPNLHVVIASRRRPQFSISLLVAQGVVASLLADELVFSGAETRALLCTEMADDDAELIARKTEGWPVAVTLAKLWFRQSGRRPTGLAEFRGSVTDVSAYLAEQVIAGVSAQAREFLFDVSVLDQITPSMANAIRGRDDAGARLHELLEFGPLVTVLHSTDLSVRLHPLLTEHLTETLRIHQLSRFNTLHEAAAGEYMKAGRLLDAVRHALAASKPQVACALLVSQAPTKLCVMLGSAEVSACLRLISPQEKALHPRLRLCEIFLLMRRGEHFRAAQEFRELAAQRGDPSVDYLLESFVIEAVVGFRSPRTGERKLEELDAAYRACGRVESWASMVIETLAMVVNLRAGRLERARAGAEIQRAAYAGTAPSGSSLHISLHVNHTLIAEGRLAEAEVGLRKVLRMARSVVGPDRSITVITRDFLAYIYYEADRDDLAESELDNLLRELDRTDAWFDHYALAYMVAIEFAYRTSGWSSASRLISRGRICARRQALGDSFEFLLRTLEADLATRDGNLDLAGAWLDAPDTSDVPLTFYERDALARAKARLSLARANPQEALEHASRWHAEAVMQGRHGAICRSRLVKALALHRMGSLEKSAAEFQAALQWAASESAVAPFLEFRRETMELLQALEAAGLAARGDQDEFLARLRHKTGQGASMRRICAALTRREMEILQLLRDSESNKHIARASKITEDAVKFHLKNIYRKLGVHSRAEALRAMESAGSG